MACRSWDFSARSGGGCDSLRDHLQAWSPAPPGSRSFLSGLEVASVPPAEVLPGSGPCLDSQDTCQSSLWTLFDPLQSIGLTDSVYNIMEIINVRSCSVTFLY